MANTYTQLRVQIVFSVKGRANLIFAPHRNQVEQYITGFIQNRGHKLLAIFCMPDHIHILIGLHPKQSISKLVEEVKITSSKFIRKQPWMPFHFEWQRGYGAFSYSKSHTKSVIRYILNQESIHKKRTFQQEYTQQLKDLGITYDDRFLFDFY